MSNLEEWNLTPSHYHPPCPKPFPSPCNDVQVQQLSELEGTMGMDAASGSAAFRVLTTLVEGWLLDAGRRNNA